MEQVSPYFPRSHGIPHVDDRKTLSGIIFVIRNGVRWRDVPNDNGHRKTIYNRFIRWSKLEAFNKIRAEHSAEAEEPEQIMIDMTHCHAK